MFPDNKIHNFLILRAFQVRLLNGINSSWNESYLPKALILRASQWKIFCEYPESFWLSEYRNKITIAALLINEERMIQKLMFEKYFCL